MELKNKKTTLKFSLKKYKNSLGKNNSKKITIGNRGSGHKRRYRQINFKSNINFLGIIFNIEYDPNRNCKIASVYNFKTNNFFYKIAAKDLKIGNIIKSGIYAENKIGHTMLLRKIPIGCCIHNISIKSNGFSKMTRSAGTYSIILEKTNKYVKILLSSGKKKKLYFNSLATIGIISNQIFFLLKLGKAGKSRWLNKRPNVRGVAKNPVDHPHGGGEGKKSGKRKNPWGKVTNSRK